MSGKSLGGTLTGGIQDLSALLPLLGSEQCEKHVGSALEGGFLYAAATPLSLFGSLGIARAGISVLIASISIPKPSFSFTPPPKLSFTSSRRLWCGARVLDNAGFKLVGRVAPLIGMDEKRYKAESRLIEILKEKHIDTPEKLSIQWRSTEWNTYLVISTIVAALISGVPYLYLLLKDPPSAIHSPWVFPFLRSVGSCLTAVCCQFLIQSRVISLMKSRLIFMTMHRLLVHDLKQNGAEEPESVLKDQRRFRWDESFPAEECLWSLERYLVSKVCTSAAGFQSLPLKERLWGFMQSKVCIPKAKDIETNRDSDNAMEEWVSVPPNHFYPYRYTWPFSEPDHILYALITQHAEHFPTSHFHRTFIVVSWLLLLISLPAAVAGYIGCFTLVTNSRSSGPLVWLGLEAVLSALRILLWAWNPSFDEKTGIAVNLKLTEKGPPMTTHWSIHALHAINDCQVSPVPERSFLEQITPYTGPLGNDHFRRPDNVALHFVLTVNKEHTQRGLLMIVLDLTDRTAITLYHGRDFGFGKQPVCFNTLVTSNTDTGNMVATIRWHLPIGTDHPQWSKNLVHELARYYDSLLQSLNRQRPEIGPVARLRWKWSLDPNNEKAGRSEEGSASLNLTDHDVLHLQQSYEHHLKTRLMEIWGGWIVDSVKAMYREGCDANFVLMDPTSDQAQQELYALNVLLVHEWTKRELAHLQFSATLENVLRAHVKENTEKGMNTDQKMSLSIEWSSVQKGRLEYERAQVMVRREDMLKTVAENALASIWQAGQSSIEKWAAAIEGGSFEEGSSTFPEATTVHDLFGKSHDAKCASMERLKLKFARWNDQWSYERHEMEATLERIGKADMKQLEQAYKYPEPGTGWADHIHSRLAYLPSDLEKSAFVAKVSSATVYDVRWISTIDVIRTVAEKSSCRSLIDVRRDLIQGIPENDHLLFCSAMFQGEVNLPFIQRNRNRWWEQQKTNSWTFYLCPREVDSGRYVFSWKGTIAHIMIFLQAPTRLRLHLLHSRYEDDVELSIQEEGKQLRVLHKAEIYKSTNELRLQGYNLDQFEPGRHELQLVVVTPSDSASWYNLRDIALEFVDSPSESIAWNSTSLP